jgi:hypothetical protein
MGDKSPRNTSKAKKQKAKKKSPVAAPQAQPSVQKPRAV